MKYLLKKLQTLRQRVTLKKSNDEYKKPPLGGIKSLNESRSLPVQKKTTKSSSMSKKINTPTVRKTVAKKVAKKTAVKKVSKQAPAKKVTKKSPISTTSFEQLQYADEETSFWVADGKILNSLVALHEALQVMDRATFAHHVSNDKNDFAEWVKDVLGDTSCATELKKTKTLATAKTAVAKSLKFYSY